jgi:hypothetical protein
VIDILLQIAGDEKNILYKNQNVRLAIADCILKIDPINEEALEIKCSSLYKMNKKGLAKTAYDNFTREYKLLLGEPYIGAMKNFIKD